MVDSPCRLLVRCVAQPVDNGQWQAFSLEFGLAAQADSFPAVRAKLDSMIACYLEDALIGQDREHARELLARRAAPSVYCKYYVTRLVHWFSATLADAHARAFKEPMPLTPQRC